MKKNRIRTIVIPAICLSGMLLSLSAFAQINFKVDSSQLDTSTSALYDFAYDIEFMTPTGHHKEKISTNGMPIKYLQKATIDIINSSLKLQATTDGGEWLSDPYFNLTLPAKNGGNFVCKFDEDFLKPNRTVTKEVTIPNSSNCQIQ